MERGDVLAEWNSAATDLLAPLSCCQAICSVSKAEVWRDAALPPWCEGEGDFSGGRFSPWKLS